MKKEPQKLSVVLLKTAFYYLLYFWLLYFFAWNDGLKALSGADVTCRNPGDECGEPTFSSKMIKKPLISLQYRMICWYEKTGIFLDLKSYFFAASNFTPWCFKYL